jgi:hypothetical protein
VRRPALTALGGLGSIVLLGLACATSAPPVSPAPAAVGSPLATRSSSVADPFELAARRLRARAEAHEPATTATMQRLAEAAGGHLHKLEYRLKTVASAARKLRKRAVEAGTPAGEAALDDMLRYTLVVEDRPAGHHLATIRAVLGRLEAEGHRPVRLKNYWPRGDNYSGVNGVLEAPDGLRWELQFHTPASIEVQAATRADYERLRALSTPIEARRGLFRRMAEAWAAVPIPTGLLEPGALPAGQLVEIPPP